MKVMLYLTALIFATTTASDEQHRAEDITKRIVGGTRANITDYPYQVLLYYGQPNSYTPRCGGAIIGAKYILTAGHCVKGTKKDQFLIKVGLDDKKATPDQTCEVDEIYLHDKYTLVSNAAVNDIAVIKCKQPFKFNSKVQAVALPASGSTPSNSTCVVTGFGKTNAKDKLEGSRYLLKADVSIISNEECKKALQKLIDNTNNFPVKGVNICTLTKPNRGTCNGDSGGPLVQDGKLIGIVSLGLNPCEKEGRPSLYTQVSTFVKWIKKKMAS